MIKSSPFHRCRSTLAAILTLPFLIAATPATNVTLSITNADTRSLRCMVVFAHWVTSDFGPIASGETVSVVMARGPDSGALHIARFDGRPMMIENIVCGIEQDWSDSFDQLPLMRVRDSGASAYQIACHAAPQIICTPSLKSAQEGGRLVADQ